MIKDTYDIYCINYQYLFYFRMTINSFFIHLLAYELWNEKLLSWKKLFFLLQTCVLAWIVRMVVYVLLKIMKPYVIVPLVTMVADVKIGWIIVSKVLVIMEELVCLEPLHIHVPVHLVNSRRFRISFNCIHGILVHSW